MTDTSRTSSPHGKRFPFIDLEKSLDRAKILYDADRNGRPMQLGVVFEVWEYSDKSSGGFQTIAALKSYGILDTDTAGDSRKVGLSKNALKYFKEERDEERNELKKVFALRPKMLALLWKQWKDFPPSDNVARSHLKVDLDLGEQQARSLLGIYKSNLAFAELKGADEVAESDGDDSDEIPEIPQQTQLVSDIKSANKSTDSGSVTTLVASAVLPVAMGERVLTTGILSKDANFRLLVTGHIGPREVERLIQKLMLDKEILADVGST